MIYTGVAHNKPTIQTVRIPRDDVLATDYVQTNGLAALEGQVIRYNKYANSKWQNQD